MWFRFCGGCFWGFQGFLFFVACFGIFCGLFFLGGRGCDLFLGGGVFLVFLVSFCWGCLGFFAGRLKMLRGFMAYQDKLIFRCKDSSWFLGGWQWLFQIKVLLFNKQLVGRIGFTPLPKGICVKVNIMSPSGIQTPLSNFSYWPAFESEVNIDQM